MRCGCAHAAVGGLHDSCEDEAAVDAGRVCDVDDRFVDGGDLVCAVASDVPSVAGLVDLLLVGGESRSSSDISSLLNELVVYLQVVEGKPISFSWPSFRFGAIASVTLVSLFGAKRGRRSHRGAYEGPESG